MHCNLISFKDYSTTEQIVRNSTRTVTRRVTRQPKLIQLFSSVIPSRGDKIIKIAKGRLKDLIFQIHPAGSRASPYGLHHFPKELSTMFCSGCLRDQTSYPTSAIESKILVLIATLKYHLLLKHNIF